MLGLCWRMLAPCWPMLSHLGGCVGHMLGICWLSCLCWGYVRQFKLKTIPRQLFPIFPTSKAKTMEKLTFFDIANIKFSAAEGPKTL